MESKFAGLYQHEFYLGEKPVIALAGETVMSDGIKILLGGGESTQERREVISRGSFRNMCGDILYQDPMALANFLNASQESDRIVYLFAHGHFDPWKYETSKGRTTPVQGLLDSWGAFPFLINSCNPKGVELPSRGLPVLYSGNEMYFLKGFDDVRLAVNEGYQGLGKEGAKDFLQRHIADMNRFDEKYGICSGKQLEYKVCERERWLDRL